MAAELHVAGSTLLGKGGDGVTYGPRLVARGSGSIGGRLGK